MTTQDTASVVERLREETVAVFDGGGNPALSKVTFRKPSELELEAAALITRLQQELKDARADAEAWKETAKTQESTLTVVDSDLGPKLIKSARLATIEECAKVAERFPASTYTAAEIAKSIRALSQQMSSNKPSAEGS